MIESIRLKNYKAFEDTGYITIAPVTLIMGKNSSGKSSVIKLFPFISEAVSRGILSECRLYPIPEIKTLRLGSRFEDLFHFRKFVNLEISLQYSDSLSLELSFLMNEGKFLPRFYALKHKESAYTRIYSDAAAASDSTLHGFINTEILTSAQVPYDRLTLKVHYIGPLRSYAPYRLEREEASSDTYVGYDGRKAYGILLNSWLTDRKVFDAVSQWMHDNMEGQGLEFESIDTQGTLFSLMVCRDNIKVNIADVGIGIMQVLPIIVQTFLQNPNTIVVIEQPGIHLHPAAHAAIAAQLAKSAQTTCQRYVVESHSENIVLGLRRAVADKKNDFNSTDAKIYFIHSEEKPFRIEEITINEHGMLSSWPTGVFSENLSLLEEIEDFQS